MPTFYNFRQDGVDYSFDDIFVPADMFRDGNLFTWGNATNGSIGNAIILGNISTPVTTFSGGANWKQISGRGELHTTAIKTDGTLWTWGYDNLGRLGNRQITLRSTPITTFAGGTNWKQTSSGGAHSGAIKTDGTLWMWGWVGWGQLGNGTITANTSTPITTFSGGTNWKQVSCGNLHTAAIKTDGTLWVWGNQADGRLGNGTTSLSANTSTPVTTFAGGNNWKYVTTPDNQTVAIKTDGTLWTWGSGAEGQLGNASTINVSTPVTTFAGGTNWKTVSGGDRHTAAIKTDGTLWIWGRPFSGELGNRNTANVVSTPITTFAGGNNWKDVEGYSNATIAIKTDGTLWTWGTNISANLGINATGDRSTPVTTFLGGSNWKSVSGGMNRAMTAITYDDPGI